MKEVCKDAFLILRVEMKFKDRLLAKAKRKNRDLSRFIREILEEWLKQS